MKFSHLKRIKPKRRQCHSCQSWSPTGCSLAPWTWGKLRLKFALTIFHKSLLTPWASLLIQLNIREASLLLCLSWWQTLLLLLLHHHLWPEFGEQLAPLRAWSRCIPSSQFWVDCNFDESGMLLLTCERQQQLEQESQEPERRWQEIDKSRRKMLKQKPAYGDQHPGKG